MSIDSILNSVTTNNLNYSNYLFFGEEPFFIDTLELAFLQHVIKEWYCFFRTRVTFPWKENIAMERKHFPKKDPECFHAPHQKVQN